MPNGSRQDWFPPSPNRFARHVAGGGPRHGSIGGFKTEVKLEQPIFCCLIARGAAWDQELSKPIYTSPSLRVFRPTAGLQLGSNFSEALGTLTDFTSNLVAALRR